MKKILFAALAVLAVMIAPATSMAAPVKFGSKLNPTVQPSNSLPGLGCGEVAGPCTFVQNEAYGRPDGGELAPKTGTIKKIRLIAGGPGSFKLQIAKVKRSTLFGTNEAKVVASDETIRPHTTIEGLAALKPAFESLRMAERFPEIRWSVTAGNSSQLADGAAAALIMSAAKAEALGLTPRARFHAFALASDDPITMLSAPIPATERILERTGMAITDFDQIEINEAFAPVPLAWADHFGLPLDRVNPRGGAIALGHPLGASGGRLLVSLLCGLEESGGRWGLQTMCEAGGMANATIIERI